MIPPDIQTLLDAHHELLEEVKSRGILEEWRNFRHALTPGRRCPPLPVAVIQAAEKKIGLSFPPEWVYLLTEIGFHQQNDLWVLLNPEREFAPHLILRSHLSLEFAMAIVDSCNKIPVEQQEVQLAELRASHPEWEELNHPDYSLADFCLEFGEEFYEPLARTFTFPILQKIFETNGKPDNWVRTGLITWTHCGGEGGILLSAPFEGNSLLSEHENGVHFNRNGREYFLPGDHWEHYSVSKISAYKDDIERDLKVLADFLRY